MSAHEALETSLLKAYSEITERNSPAWAVHKRNSDELVKPTIPFVGKHYLEQPKKILVYASAENLAGYYPGNMYEWEGDWLDDDKQAENRHRKCFDEPSFQTDPFFPHVHIGPMNNGCLATAVYYVVERICHTTFTDPRTFYETIAFGNYSKFSIETEWQRNIRTENNRSGSKDNKDLTQIPVKEARDKLGASILYLKADIEMLNPDIIILPKALYDINKKAFDEIRGQAMIIPIYQINTRVINLHITSKHPHYDITMLSKSVRTWYDWLQQEGMTGKNKANYLSVFTYLDDVLERTL